MSRNVPQILPELSETQLPLDLNWAPAQAFAEATQSLGIPRRSIALWWNEPAFRELFIQQWYEASSHSASEITTLMLKALLALPEHLASNGSRKPDRIFRYVSVSNIETADDERERKALERLHKLVTEARNNRNCSSHSDHGSASRPWRHSGEAPSYPVLRKLFPGPRLDS